MEQCIAFLFTWNPQQQLPDVPTTVPGEEFPDRMEGNSATSPSDAMAIENEGTIYERYSRFGKFLEYYFTTPQKYIVVHSSYSQLNYMS